MSYSTSAVLIAAGLSTIAARALLGTSDLHASPKPVSPELAMQLDMTRAAAVSLRESGIYGDPETHDYTVSFTGHVASSDSDLTSISLYVSAKVNPEAVAKLKSEEEAGYERFQLFGPNVGVSLTPTEDLR